VNREEQKKLYKEVLHFHDLAEKLIASVENSYGNKEVEIELITPVIEQIGESTEVLADAYIDFIKNGEKAGAGEIKKVEMALRKIFAVNISFIEKLKTIKNSY